MMQKWVPATVLFLLLQIVHSVVEVAPKVPSSGAPVVHESSPVGPPPPHPDPHPSVPHPSDSNQAVPHPSLPHPSIPHPPVPHPQIPHPDAHAVNVHFAQHPDPHGAPPTPHSDPHGAPPTPHSDPHGAPPTPNSDPHGAPPPPPQDAKAAAQKDGTPHVGTKGSDADGNSLSFSSSSGTGPSSRQCSFTVSNPNTFQASSDSFGYPKFMVDDAAKNNPLASGLFKKMSQSKNAGGDHFVVPPSASGPSHTPRFVAAGRRIPGIGDIGQAAGNPSPQGLDINSMFAKIGQHADNEGLGEFPHDTPSFPDHAINPGRQFGPGQLQSSFKSRDPFSGGDGGDGGLGGVGGFAGFHFRKKRQAGPNYGLGQGFKNQLENVCPFKSDYIRKFKKHNSDCYVYKPELQGHKLATCSQEACGHCGGSGKCVAEKQSAMIWAYCQAGPNARRLELEYVEYPAYCVCKTISC